MMKSFSGSKPDYSSGLRTARNSVGVRSRLLRKLPSSTKALPTLASTEVQEETIRSRGNVQNGQVFSIIRKAYLESLQLS